ncbi:MAG: ribokinase [Oscillibacter sp.]|jgi:ribokinase|nr:ribokinase [Oscillibacter sp.]
MGKRPRILVVGSLVMDLTVGTERFPKSGETVLGRTFSTAPGGKGANQAVQAARLGADVSMAGAVGEDLFGRELLASLEKSGVDTDRVAIRTDAPTAVGNILLEAVPGEAVRNRIIVVPGANHTLTAADTAFLKEEIGRYDMMILQLEIPMEVNEAAARYAFDAGVPVMLNPAPYAALSPELLRCVTYLSPNEHEAAGLTGLPLRTGERGRLLSDTRAAAEKLRLAGAENVLITLGENGAVLCGADGFAHEPCVAVPAVADPTAAGDSFVGAFCTGLCAGLPRRQALQFAAAAAALTVSRPGAQPSLPMLFEVVELLRTRALEEFDWAALQNLEPAEPEERNGGRA